MVLRTASRQAEVLAVLTENPDHDLYQISSHGTTCPLCAPLEGRVYSKSGRDPDFPPSPASLCRRNVSKLFGTPSPRASRYRSHCFLSRRYRARARSFSRYALICASVRGSRVTGFFSKLIQKWEAA